MTMEFRMVMRSCAAGGLGAKASAAVDAGDAGTARIGAEGCTGAGTKLITSDATSDAKKFFKMVVLSSIESDHCETRDAPY